MSIIKIRDICKVVDYRDLEILAKVGDRIKNLFFLIFQIFGIGETLDYVCETISSFINFGQSKLGKKLVLHQGLSTEVDELREVFNIYFKDVL